ncbi:NUDIX domain-containing protein [Hyphobacterium sp. HN65]|uniref:NUDIX domain-containing protein n=1 Tax=Hyphobacterium lacteum TaxID=3116575 RepID=A0ABU7LR85_9PROT|nr:NUDIX domain-containing protein [Hyphobacterium sp. HN65]MEE2526418.1 NUDIX domain-containing protein [Hyphobacterium sp. HN65]
MTGWRIRLEPVIRPLMRLHWRRTRGMTLGVRGLALDSRGRVCLVRHTYMAGWHLPGGGVERGETVWQAIEKEMREEAGVALTGAPDLFHVYSNERKFSGDHIALFVVRDWSACPPEPGQEIAETRWFAPDALPQDISPATARRIDEVLSGAAPEDEW